MPTAPKLVAALWYALVAWFAAQLVTQYLPEGSQVGQFALISAAFGFLVGWTFSGARAGDTMRAALGYGITSAAILALYCVFYFSFEEMLHRAVKKRYDGPMHAVVSHFDLMRENALFLIKPDVFLTLIVGGLFGGWLTEKVGRKWP